MDRTLDTTSSSLSIGLRSSTPPAVSSVRGTWKTRAADAGCSTRLIAARDLSAHEVSIWSEIQRTTPELDSPFFRPEFTQAAAAVREDIEVGVLEKNRQPVGFFPFYRTPGGVARAVGGRLSDLHGVVVSRSTAWSPARLIEECGLRAWYFDHLIQSQVPLQPFHWCEIESPCLDLREGFDQYCEDLRLRGSRQLRQVLRKARKLKREVGPLSLEIHSGDDRAFQSLLKWKAQQYGRTRRLDIFQYDWVGELLDRIRTSQADGFRGLLSVLNAGDKIAAVHLGIRSDNVLHWWFPTYNPELAQYSPGLILLCELAKASESVGIRRIDLGKGDERYKASLSNGAIPIAEGSVDLRHVRKLLWRSWHACKRAIRGSRYRSVLEVPLNLSRRFREWAMFR